ncbi:MAG: hypothetical protein U9N52_07670 [Campylobacterota bacterium]|nr:hypothetical protein [Campylobacterota bacterium]
MKSKYDIDELKAEFNKFVREECHVDPENTDKQQPDQGDPADEEPVPAFVDDIADKLLSPAKSGVYLSRLDIKRVAEAIDESLPIKERKKMIKMMFRHTTKKAYLRSAFDEFNRHMNGRVLIYQELAEAFPASKYIFDANIAKVKKTQKMFDQIVNDYEEMEPTSDPMII